MVLKSLCGCGACANAVSACFGTNLTTLMCFFFMYNKIFKNVYEKLKSEVIQDVNFMHFCKSECEFVIAKSNIYIKWMQNK